MATLTEDEVLSALKQCYDPEIPVNIVDLGLIYGVRFEPGAGRKAGRDRGHDAYRPRVSLARHDR
jgi:hypothetical protein